MMAAAATTRLRGVLLVLATLLGALGPACQPLPTPGLVMDGVADGGPVGGTRRLQRQRHGVRPA